MGLFKKKPKDSGGQRESPTGATPGAYSLHVYVVFNKDLPEVLAREAAEGMFKDLVKRKPELAKIVSAVSEDAMMNLAFSSSSREMAKDEFEKVAADTLGRWAAGKMSPGSAHMPFVQTSSFQAVGPDGKRFEALYAIAVVVA